MKNTKDQMCPNVNPSKYFKPGKISSGGLIEKYLHHLGGKKNRAVLTLNFYKNDLRQFVSFLSEFTGFDSENPDDLVININIGDVAGYVDYLQSRYSRSTLNRKITAVRGLYRYLVSTAQCNTNPFADVRIQSAQAASPEYLGEADLQQLFDVIAGTHWLACRDRAILAMLYSTGMRVSELRNLTYEDIDFDEAVVYIHTAGRQTRSCRLSPWAWQTVERYMNQCPFGRNGGLGSKDVLFVNRQGKSLTARSVRRKLTNYSRRAGLSVEATPAILRHSCAVHMLQNGSDVKTVRNLLGHLSPSSMRPYLNCLLRTQNQSIARS